MPINIKPTDIVVEQVTRSTITADKLHILKLIISDPTKSKPGIEMQCVAYAEDEKGNKQFGTVISTLRTTDLYAAMVNLAGVGLTKIQEAMQSVFDAAGELVKYQQDRLAEAEAIKPEFEKAKAAYDAAVASKDATQITTAQESLNTVFKQMAKLQAAANDPANPMEVVTATQ